MKRQQIFTIGHSTRTIEELVEAIRAYSIERLVDVRTIPKSRTNPQFNKEAIGKSLNNRHISYRHMKDLGGLRAPAKNSINSAWRNASFRGYADYMQTDEFASALDQLIKLAAEKTSVIMCAEALPWRCHRSLIADALIIKNIEVFHIFSAISLRPHRLSKIARVTGSSLSYPSLEI